MSQRTTGQVAWLFPPRTRGLWLCVIFLFGQTICLCPAMPYGLDRQSALAAGINKIKGWSSYSGIGTLARSTLDLFMFRLFAPFSCFFSHVEVSLYY